MIPWPVSESSWPVGSSASSSCGWLARARAMATRCCSPPDSSCGRWPSLPPEPDELEQLADPPVALPRLGVDEPQRDLDVLGRRQDRHEPERLEDEGDRSAAGGRRARPRSSRSGRDRRRSPVPAVGRSSPPRRLRSVDLPLPERPLTATSRPRPIDEVEVSEGVDDAVAGGVVARQSDRLDHVAAPAGRAVRPTCWRSLPAASLGRW